MAKRKSRKARSGPPPKQLSDSTGGPPPTPVATTVNHKFVSHRDQNMHAQHFEFEAEMFDTGNRDDLVALETLFVLNHGIRIEDDFEYRGSVFVGDETSALLHLQWLAMLFVDVDSGDHHYFSLRPCQSKPSYSTRECLGRIRGIRTGYEGNSGSANSEQRARWERAAKLVLDWQMPISMITFALTDPSDPNSRDVRLFVPHSPESIYNTMALQMWRQTIEAG